MKKKLLIFTISVLAIGVLAGCSAKSNTKKAYSDETEKVNKVDDSEEKNGTETEDQLDDEMVKIEKKANAQALADGIAGNMQTYETDIMTESIEGSIPDSIDISVEYGNIVSITDEDEKLKSYIQNALEVREEEYKDYEKIDIRISKKTEREFPTDFEVTVTIDDIKVTHN